MSATWPLIAANVRTHARRYVATCLAVAMCVAFIAACLSFSAGMRSFLMEQARRDYAGADAVVTVSSAASGPVDLESLIPRLDQADGVRSVIAVKEAFGTVRSGRGGSHSSSRSIIVPLLPGSFNGLTLDEGRLPTQEADAVISSGLAESLRVGLGDQIEVPLGFPDETTRTEEFRVVGISREAAFTIPTLTLTATAFETTFPDETARTLLVAGTGHGGRGAEPRTVAAAEEALTGEAGAEVTSASAMIEARIRESFAQQRSFMATIAVFPVIAVCVGLIVVSTTFSVTFAGRRRELALLRLIGARQRQVRLLMLAEAAAVGAAGGFLGLVLGLPVGALGVAGLGLATSARAAAAATSTPVVVALWCGSVLLTVLVGLRPARAVARVSPLVALDPAAGPDSRPRRRYRLRLALAVVCLLAGGAGATVGLSSPDHSTSAFFLTAASCLPLLLGALLLCTAFTPALIHTATRPLPGITTLMARENTQRHPERTAATATSIIIGVTLVVTMLVGALSAQKLVITTLDERKPFDFWLMAAEEPLRPQEQEEIRALGGVEASVALPGITATVIMADGGSAPEADSVSDPGVAMVLGEPDLGSVAHAAVASPGRGEAFVGTGSPWVGQSRIRLCSDAGACRDFTVREVSRVDGGTILISASDLHGWEPNAPTRAMVLRMSDDGDAERLGGEIEEINPGLAIGGSAMTRQEYMQVIETMLSAVVALLGVAIVVALVGMANMLSLSVAERRREYGLLRALGMSRRSVRHMVAVESLFIGGMAALVGCLLGVFFAWIGLQALPFENLAARSLVIPWWRLAAVITVALLAAILAAVIPARRAASVSPTEALAAL